MNKEVNALVKKTQEDKGCCVIVVDTGTTGLLRTVGAPIDVAAALAYCMHKNPDLVKIFKGAIDAYENVPIKP